MRQNRIKIFTSALVSILLLLQAGSALAFQWLGPDGLQHEVGGPYDWPPYYGGSAPNSELLGHSFSIVDDYTQNGQDTSRLWPINGPQEGHFYTCEGFKDPTCVAGGQKDPGWRFTRVLPRCKGESSAESCIESLTIIDASNIQHELIFDHLLPIPLQWDTSIGRGIGAGSARSLWHDPSDPDLNNGFLITVSGTGQCPPEAQCSEIQNFSASISPYKIQMGNFGGKSMWITPDGHKGIQDSAPPVCLWDEVGKCGLASDFGAISNVEMKLHLPNNISGWYMGRLRDPNISIVPIDTNYYRLTVMAKPAEVPLVTAKVDLGSMTPAQNKFFANQSCVGGGFCGPVLQSNNVLNAQFFDLFAPQLNNTAQLLVTKWSIRSVDSAFPCSQTGKVDGVVSTDATLYDGTPPSFENGSMNYHLAALHFLPNGSAFEGHYDLLMASSFARCLYKFSNAPVSAKIEVINSQGSTSISTSSLTESAGWLHLAVIGFTFSNPTIKVKLTQDASASVATPSPSPSPSATSQPIMGPVVKPSPAPMKTTITCIKGKTSKVVTAIKPTCPAGYKKK
jgi:hypothetical protein